MRFDIVTLFPESIEPYLQSSILGRAQNQKHIETRTWNIRDFTTDKHQTTDDTPYGGGAGMVLKVEPIDKAVQAAANSYNAKNRRIIVLTPRGKQFTQTVASSYSSIDQLILICGRYEGIDQRVIDHIADEELSIGPYVLAGGEIAALAVLEATARLVPGVLGNPQSLTEETFTATSEELPFIEYPQYTKPETYNSWSVPDVLLSGNHKAIEDWRKTQDTSDSTP